MAKESRTSKPSLESEDETGAQENSDEDQGSWSIDSEEKEGVTKGMGRLEQFEKDEEQFEKHTPPARASGLLVPVQPTADTYPNDVGFSNYWRKTSKFFRRAPKRYPRSWGIMFHILIPLFFLILCAGVFGYFLALFEAPQEFDTNDEILRQRFWMEGLPTDKIIEQLTHLPVVCYEAYMNGVELPPPEIWNTSTPTSSPSLFNSFLNETVLDPFNSTRRMKEEKKKDHIEIDEIELEGMELEEFLDDCGETAGAILSRLLKSETDLAVYTAVQPLTFNWIRCTNATTLEERMQTASNQSAFYGMTWEMDRARLHLAYLDELGLAPLTGDNFDMVNNISGAIDDIYGTSNVWNNSEFWDDVDGRRNALMKSVEQATGRTECMQNTPASAWFWFTVMTTVGYGNYTPETRAGHLMVVFLGLLSLLAFGAILASAGNMVKLLYEDFVKRCNLVYLKRASVSCVFWSAICVFWMYLLGKRTQSWWASRLELEVPTDASFWFAYVSTTTIGLGDYYLQPEAIFVHDVFEFSMLFLTGFVFVSTLLNSLTTVLSSSSPSKLKSRLAKTSLIQHTRRLFSSDLSDQRQEQKVQTLQDMSDDKNCEQEGDDRNLDRATDQQEHERDDVAMLAKEVELLELLLSRSRGKLLEEAQDRLDEEQLSESSPRTLEQVREEEELLHELWTRLKAERAHLEGGGEINESNEDHSVSASRSVRHAV